MVVETEIVLDRGLEFEGAAMDATADLLLRQLGEPPFDEIDPGSALGVKWTWRRGRLANRRLMSVVLCVP